MPNIEKTKGKAFTCLDLFSGAGGLSRGFMDAGFKVVLGVDFDDMALKTFKANHGGADVMKLDLFNHDNLSKIIDYLNDKKIELDVLVGGPPCQGFSLAGPRNVDDKRNTLYQAMVKLARMVKPKVVVLENVPGLLKLYEGRGAKRIIEDFSEIGYRMSCKILYAPDYGIPQIRKRVFFVGILNGKKPFEYPTPICDPKHYVTCEDAIGDLPALVGIYGEEVQDYPSEPLTDYQRLMRKNSSKLYNHIGTIHDEKTVRLISMVPEGKNYKSLPIELGGKFKYHEALTRYHSQRPSLTINTGHRSHFHYKYNRIPTVRESARLQSFPDDFIFYGNKSQQYKQVGNAVPPMLGKQVAQKIKEYLIDNDSEPSKKIKFIDLFAGCGGLEEGFLQTGLYTDVAAVEWLEPQVDTLRKRLKEKWGIDDSTERVMRFDIQREKELFLGWHDEEYGEGVGIDHYVEEANGIDIIIGGPPCQAYSLAGRVRDENGMRNDYRNYLFEHYLAVVNRYKPQLFVFENVPGILSAAPDGVLITDKIKTAIRAIGYDIIEDIGKYAVVNASEYGVPQSRKRVIILGIRNNAVKDTQSILKFFYEKLLTKYKDKEVKTVFNAIGDLPPCMPLEKAKGKVSHSTPSCATTWHTPRFHSTRDMDTFRLLAADLQSGECKYTSSSVLSELYEQKVGSKSPIHRYHVLRPNEPSTTIIAHLYKDGNRYIHYDPNQARTITPREAARLQSFPDDFDFVGSRGSVYQMIGNAVPPLLAHKVALAVSDLFEIVNMEGHL